MKLRALFLFLVAGFLITLPHAASAAGTSTAPLPRCSMSTTPSTVIKGGSFTLKWSSTNATSANIPGPGLGNVNPNGQRNLIPVRSTKLTGTFTGPGGKATCQAIIVVLNQNGSPMPVVAYDDPSYGDPFVFVDGNASGGGTTPAPGSAASGGTFSGPQSSSGGGSSQPSSGAPSFGSGNTQSNTPASAPSSQLVPCDGVGCQACNLVQLSQRIINFLLGLSIPLAAAMFAYAGVLYFTSSVSNQIEKAKKVFKAVFIGFIIVIGAWLAIQTLMNAILDKDYKSWNEISCVGGRRTSESINTLLNSIGVLTSNLNTTPQYDATSWQGSNVTVDQQSVLQGAEQYGNTFLGSLECADEEATLINGMCVGGKNGSEAPIQRVGSGAGIAAAAARFEGYITANVPNTENGNKACAWAVNQIIKSEGYATLGDGYTVASMKYALENQGRGDSVTYANAQPGDLVVWKTPTVSHIGICENAGCTSVISNSSSDRAFTNRTGPVLKGVTGELYRLK